MLHLTEGPSVVARGQLHFSLHRTEWKSIFLHDLSVKFRRNNEIIQNITFLPPFYILNCAPKYSISEIILIIYLLVVRVIDRTEMHILYINVILTVHLNLYLIPAAIFSASVIEEGMIGSPQSLQVLLLRSSNISFSPTTNLLSDKMDISCWFSSLILLFLKGRIQNPECKVNSVLRA